MIVYTVETIGGQITSYEANQEICPFTPAHVAKVFGGYMCFESDNDYRVWKNQK